ncbi:MAG: methyltransferase [Paramuribaculum sp.]|nr:methyltransferase [Paramuribaculum sp.]
MSDFRFKQFSVSDSRSAMKIGTDGVLLGAWTPLPDDSSHTPVSVWDIGAGTGLLSLMIAQRLPSSQITAIEIDPGASQDARDNFVSSPWADRLNLINSDIFALSHNLPSPDLIVCNPPFYNEDIHAPQATRSTARHEGSLGIEPLISLASRILLPGGALSFIAPWKRLDDIEYIAALHRLTPTHLVPVIARQGRDPIRVLSRLVKDAAPTVVDRTPITLRDSSNSYTSQYIQLTDPFYLFLH